MRMVEIPFYQFEIVKDKNGINALRDANGKMISSDYVPKKVKPASTLRANARNSALP